MSGFRLTSCVWELTVACCFGGRYCGSAGGRARADELSTAECMDAAEQLADLGCRRVSLIGGEVFLRRDWAQIAGRLTGLGVRVDVITNGYMMSPEVLEQLKQAGVSSVAVSIDGPEDVHDAGRQAGSFKRAMEAVRALTAAGMPVSVISTLRRDCMGRLEELYRVLEGSGIAAWQLQACSPMGSAARGLDWRIDPAEVIAFVMQHRAEAPFMLGAADNVGYFTDEELRLRGADGACFQGCRAGISAIGIDSAGNVRGCESLYDERFNEGNLRQRKLRDIWEDPGAFAYNRQFRREMLTGSCARCRMGPWCAGGCRSYNYFVHGKLYESPAGVSRGLPVIDGEIAEAPPAADEARRFRGSAPVSGPGQPIQPVRTFVSWYSRRRNPSWVPSGFSSRSSTY